MKVSGAGFKRRSDKKGKNISTLISEPDAEVLRSARSDFVQRTIEAGEPWTDPVFPPVFSSLAKEDRNVDDISKFRKIEWKRIPDLFPNP